MGYRPKTLLEDALSCHLHHSILITLTGLFRYTWLKMLFLVLKIGQMVFWNQLGRSLISLNGAKARRLAPHSVEYKIIPA